MMIRGWRTVEGAANNAVDRHTGQKVISGREVLASEGPCFVERTGAFPEFVQSIDCAVVTDAVSLAAIFDLDFRFVDLQQVVMLAHRRFRGWHLALQCKSVSAFPGMVRCRFLLADVKRGVRRCLMLWTHRQIVECVRLESRRTRDSAHSPYARQCVATIMSALRAATAASKQGIESPVWAVCDCVEVAWHGDGALPPRSALSPSKLGRRHSDTTASTSISTSHSGLTKRSIAMIVSTGRASRQ